MFANIVNKLLKKSDKPVACADTAEPAKGRRGRTLSELALRAHGSVAAVLTTEPMTRGKILATLGDEAERAYADANWQNVIARLITEGKAKLAEGGPTRGRGVSYQRVG